MSYYHIVLVFCCIFVSKDICICLVSQVDFNASETSLRAAIHEALLQCNLFVLFSSKLFDKHAAQVD